MTSFGDLLGPGRRADASRPSEPQPILLPGDPSVSRELGDGVDPARVAAAHPTASAAWAALAERALADGEEELDSVIAGYAYARTGYHRGLDLLRRNGWKGFGPVPWSHEDNRGFLRCVGALARAAQRIGEADEHSRCLNLLEDCDPVAARELGFR